MVGQGVQLAKGVPRLLEVSRAISLVGGVVELGGACRQGCEGVAHIGRAEEVSSRAGGEVTEVTQAQSFGFGITSRTQGEEQLSVGDFFPLGKVRELPQEACVKSSHFVQSLKGSI